MSLKYHMIYISSYFPKNSEKKWLSPLFLWIRYTLLTIALPVPAPLQNDGISSLYLSYQYPDQHSFPLCNPKYGCPAYVLEKMGVRPFDDFFFAKLPSSL